METSNKRRMPENLKRYLVRLPGNKMYLPAAYRVVWFRDELPHWSIITEIVEGGLNACYAVVKATILNEEGRVIATGHKTETREDFQAGWVEKAESGAIARALAFIGFGTQFTPELDEKPERPADSPVHRLQSEEDPPSAAMYAQKRFRQLANERGIKDKDALRQWLKRSIPGLYLLPFDQFTAEDWDLCYEILCQELDTLESGAEAPS